jgi:hypothetical protein
MSSVLLAASIGFRYESFINFHKLDEHTMGINYLACLVFVKYYFDNAYVDIYSLSINSLRFITAYLFKIIVFE